MAIDQGRSFENRRRAESFGAVAEQYDRARPTYPDALLDELAASVAPGAEVLDVGCGTGKAAVPLTARGLRVLGVEVDAKMADVARARGIAVEVSSFETWDDRGRRFDLLTCAQAWHWIDPRAGARKAAEVLRPAGRLALFWNLGEFADRIRRPVEALYDELAPELVSSPLRGGGRDLVPYQDELRAAGFRDLTGNVYRWSQDYSTAGWLELIGTHSDHNTLPPERLARLSERLGEVLDGLDGTLTIDYETRTVLATR